MVFKHGIMAAADTATTKVLSAYVPHYKYIRETLRIDSTNVMTLLCVSSNYVITGTKIHHCETQDVSSPPTPSELLSHFYSANNLAAIRLRPETSAVQFSAGAKDFSLLQNTQFVSGAHPVSCSMRGGGSFSRGKVAGT